MMKHSTLISLFGKEGVTVFRKGIRLFNAGKHREAHEAFEEVWRAQEGQTKTFVQGFVQMAAGFSYIKLKRFDSVLYLFEKATEKFAATHHLLPHSNIPDLIDAMAIARGEVERLGEGRLQEFPSSLYPRILLSTRRFRKRKKRKPGRPSAQR